MDLQKLVVKIFVQQPDTIPLTAFIDVFHGWIQASDGAYLDVADYSHMRAGPGIVLIAADANVSIDETGGRRGLLFSRKSMLQGSNREKLEHALNAAIAYCRRLETEPALGRTLRFDRSAFEISVNDRAVARNSPEAFEAFQREIGPLAHEVSGGAEVEFACDKNPRRRLHLGVKAARAILPWSRLGLANDAAG